MARHIFCSPSPKSRAFSSCLGGCSASLTRAECKGCMFHGLILVPLSCHSTLLGERSAIVGHVVAVCAWHSGWCSGVYCFALITSPAEGLENPFLPKPVRHTCDDFPYMGVPTATISSYFGRGTYERQ